MPVSAPKVLQTGNPILQRMQSNLIAAINQVLNLAPLSGNVVAMVVFSDSNTDVAVQHGLNTSSVEFIAGSLTADGTIYLSPNNETKSLNPSPNATILLRASSPMTATLWFFQTPGKS